VLLGSSGLTWFDAALVGYLFGTLFAIFGVVYRYVVWLQATPDGQAQPTRLGTPLAAREPRPQPRDAARTDRVQAAGAGLHPEAVDVPVVRAPAHLLGLHPRGARDLPPGVRGLHFESVGQDARRYQTFVADFGLPFSFDSRSVVGWFVIHALNVSAVLVLAGVFIFLARRLRIPAPWQWNGRGTSCHSRACSPCRSPG
jgi:hypothetical protein